MAMNRYVYAEYGRAGLEAFAREVDTSLLRNRAIQVPDEAVEDQVGLVFWVEDDAADWFDDLARSHGCAVYL